jgi:hypothetical protein
MAVVLAVGAGEYERAGEVLELFVAGGRRRRSHGSM